MSSHIAILSALTVFVVVAGCSKREGGRSQAVGNTHDQAAADSAGCAWDEWVECGEDEAETVLAVDLTIRDCFQNNRHVFGLRKVRCSPGDGVLRGLNFGNETISAHGRLPSGEGFSYGGGVHISEVNDAGVVFNVGYYWFPGGGRSGRIDKDATVPFHGTIDEKLTDDVHVKAFFRKPWPALRPESVPFLILQLRGPEYNAAIWRLVALGETAVPALLSAARDGDKQTRDSAVWALGHIAGRTGSKAAFAGVLDALHHSDPDTRGRAVHVCLWNHSEDATRALEEALADKDEEVREGAKRILERRRDPATRPSSP